MELTKYSRNYFLQSLDSWDIPRDYVDPVFNYLVHGWQPGSFFTSVFANDFLNAMTRSHPANSIQSLKNLAGWILNSCPPEAKGSYNAVDAWCQMSDQRRRQHLEQWGLIFTEQEEIVMALKNQRTVEPVFF